MDNPISQNELKVLIDAVQSEKVVEAFKIMETMRTCYPAGKIGDITNSLPDLGIRNDYPQTEHAFMFALGQLYQAKNNPSLQLFMKELLDFYHSRYLMAKESHDVYIKEGDRDLANVAYGMMNTYSNLEFDLRKKMSDLG